jgi:hypothetical protein
MNALDRVREDRRLRGLQRLRDDLPLYAAEALRIKAKTKEIVPLVFNRAQQGTNPCPRRAFARRMGRHRIDLCRTGARPA